MQRRNGIPHASVGLFLLLCRSAQKIRSARRRHKTIRSARTTACCSRHVRMDNTSMFSYPVIVFIVRTGIAPQGTTIQGLWDTPIDIPCWSSATSPNMTALYLMEYLRNIGWRCRCNNGISSYYTANWLVQLAAPLSHSKCLCPQRYAK